MDELPEVVTFENAQKIGSKADQEAFLSDPESFLRSRGELQNVPVFSGRIAFLDSQLEAIEKLIREDGSISVFGCQFSENEKLVRLWLLP
jgi:hypothetical protein